MDDSLSALRAYAQAAATAADVVARVPDDRWSDHGLGEWDLRALVGHTSLALVNVSTYVGRPARTEDITSPQAYYVLDTARTGEGADATAVLQRGRDAGAALGDEPATAFRELAGEATAGLSAVHADDLVETIAGGIRVGSYVATRTVELVVHGLDIAAAARVPAAFSHHALGEAAAVLVRTGVELGHGPGLLAALTGRGTLPPGYSAV